MSQLRAFVAVADHLHFGLAAAALGIAQPTLSQALAALEEILDVQLVERSPRRVLVTPAGERLLPFARRAVEAVDAVVDAAAPDRAWLAGTLRLGVIPTVAPYLLPAVLRCLAREAPDLRPRVREDQTARLLDALRLGSLDAAVVAVPTGETGLVEIPLYDEDFVLLLPDGDPLADRDDLPRSVLTDVALLLLDEGHCLRDQALDVCRQVGVVDPEADTARASSLPTVVQLVRAGHGATLLPATAVPVEARRSALSVARFAPPAPGRRVGLVFRATSARAAEYEDLAEIVRRACRSGRLPVRTVGDPVGSATPAARPTRTAKRPQVRG